MKTCMEKGERRGLILSAGRYQAAVAISRVTGLVREIVFAAVFATGPEAAAFIAAFRIPGFFRDVFAENTLSAAFLPAYVARKEREGREAADLLASRTLVFLACLVSLFVAAGMLLAPWIVMLVVPGWAANDPERYHMTVQLTRYLFPFLLLVSLTALGQAVANAWNRFFVSALPQVLINLSMILAAIFLIGFFTPPITAMVVGVIVGGLLGLLLQAVACRGIFRPRLVLPRITEDLKEVLVLSVPAVLGVAVTNVNVLVGTMAATFAEPEAIPALNYSYRLLHLPLGLLAVPLASALLPRLAVLSSKEEREEFAMSLSGIFRLVLLFAMPATVLLTLLAGPIIRLVYEYGSFGEASTGAAAAALMLYSVGVAPFALNRILTSAFHAEKDTRTPFRIGLYAVGVNITGNILSILFSWGFRGIALSAAVAGCVRLYLLHARLKPRLGSIPVVPARYLVKVLLATGGAALAVLSARAAFGGVSAGIPGRFVHLAGASLTGLIVYAAAGVALGIFSRRSPS